MTGAIDLDRLLANAGGDAAVADEVLGLFAQQADIWLRLLDGADGVQGFRDAAHTLKGAALGVGAGALAAACDRAEAQAGAAAELRVVAAGRIRDEADRALSDAAAWRHEFLLSSLRSPAKA